MITVPDELGHARTIRPEPVVELKASENYLTFRFIAAQSIPIRYKLEGLDNDWNEAMSTDKIHYANLSGGQYVFRLENQPESVTLRLDIPFWKYWWFAPVLSFYFIGVGGLIFYLFLQYRFRQKLRALQTRDRIARDLHDDMGSYLSSISILSQSAQRSVTKDPAKAQVTLDRIGQTARQVMDSMSDIVWSINPDHDSMAQVIVRMTEVASALFATEDDSPNQVSWQIDVSDEVRHINLSAESRRDFFLIYKEAITNVARYAQASRVVIRLSREGNNLCLEVADNGRGFDPQNPKPLNPVGGNGLRNMQNRAALLNGTLLVKSEPGQGAILLLHFPV